MYPPNHFRFSAPHSFLAVAASWNDVDSISIGARLVDHNVNVHAGYNFSVDAMAGICAHITNTFRPIRICFIAEIT
jgi:hypothetical protein